MCLFRQHVSVGFLAYLPGFLNSRIEVRLGPHGAIDRGPVHFRQTSGVIDGPTLKQGTEELIAVASAEDAFRSVDTCRRMKFNVRPRPRHGAVCLGILPG